MELATPMDCILDATFTPSPKTLSIFKNHFPDMQTDSQRNFGLDLQLLLHFDGTPDSLRGTG